MTRPAGLGQTARGAGAATAPVDGSVRPRVALQTLVFAPAAKQVYFPADSGPQAVLSAPPGYRTQRETTVNQQDRDFVRTALAVLVGLVLLAVIFFFAAQLLSKMSGGGPATLTMAEKATSERIAPVGRVEIGSGESAAAGAAAGGGRSGQDVYQAVCSACHATGAAGAPKVGDEAAWKPRVEQGMDGLMQSVVNGKGAMPPRGGGQASDEELRKAIVHMLQETGMEVPGGADAASADAASADAASADAASADAASADAGAQLGAAAAEDTKAGDAKAAGDQGGADLARGKEVVQKTCGTCHNTGVAGAPKIGDKEAWQPRVDQGMDALLQSTINGKGAMPPKGGGDYNEADLKAAIQYMLKETGF